MTIGVRIPNHNFPLEIVKAFKKPIITTSVNVHDLSSINDISQISKDFPNINIFFDKKAIQPSIGSTIIDLTISTPKILRQGDGKYIL